MGRHDAALVVVGRIAGAFGIEGAVKVFSYTEPRPEILALKPWHIRWRGQWQPTALLEGHVHGKGIVAHLEICRNREMAQQFSGGEIAVQRAQLPPPGAGRYYWVDLLGLDVVDLAGVSLGRVSSLMETGAHDVLVVDGERQTLIPFVQGQVVREVDLERGVLRVDWDPEF